VIVSDTIPRSAMFYVEDEQNAGLGEFLFLLARSASHAAIVRA